MASASTIKDRGNKYYPPGFDKSNLGLKTENVPAEPVVWWRPFGVTAAIAVLSLVALFSILLFPFLLAFATVRFCFYATVSYKRNPNSCRIAVIGGGWNGLQIVRRLQEQGVEDITCYEKGDDVGGTWHPNRRYAHLNIHSPAFSIQFKDFFYGASFEERDCRISGNRVHSYMRDFADHFDLRKNFSLNSAVVKIESDSGKRKASLSVKSMTDGSIQQSELFDMVIFASLAGKPVVPIIGNEAEFGGETMHTSALSEDKWKQLIEENKKVLVVGGSKSSCDTILSFIDYLPDENITWVYRRPYHFMKYEDFCHNRDFIHKIGGLLHLLCFSLAAFAPAIAWRLMMWLGFTYTYDMRGWKNDWETYRFGMLDRLQRSILTKFPNKVRGEIDRFTSTGVILKDGTIKDCDVVIWATGYTGGFEDIKLVKDNKDFQLPNMKMKLYNGAIVPTLPEVLIASSIPITTGPKGSLLAADLAIYQLCVTPGLSEEHMLKSAQRNHHIIDNNQSVLFKPGFWHNFSSYLVSLMYMGVLPIFGFLRHFAQLMIFGRQDEPLEPGILPSSHRKKHKPTVNSYSVV